MNRKYELVVILNPDIKDEGKEKLLSKIKKIIADAEGKILETKDWGKKDLAYSLAKYNQGILYCLSFSLSSEKTNSVKQKIRLEESVLRFLMVSKERRPADSAGKIICLQDL